MESASNSSKRTTGGASKTTPAAKTVSNAQRDANADADWSPAVQGETAPPPGDSGDETPPPAGTSTGASDADAELSPATGGTAPTSEMDGQSAREGRGAEAAAAVSETFERARRELSDAIGRLKTEAARVDTEQMGRQARSWVEQNPALATALAVGAGLLVGRALGAAFKPEPPTFKKRAQKKLRKAQSYAAGITDVLAGHAAATGAALATGAVAASKRARVWGADAAESASEWGERAADTAADWGGRVGDTATELGGRAAEAASEWGEHFGDSTRAARKDLRKRTKRARKSFGKRVDVAESALDAAQAAIAAVVAQRVADWSRRWR
jgi:ElaB/YqjD/DUF883 family membrane-anchored ribosome-binding protein